MTQPTVLDPHSIHEVQMMIRDLMKDRVCSLESEAALLADDMPAYSKQLMHAAREIDNMQLSVFLLLHDVWDAACTQRCQVAQQPSINRPSLPQITPLSNVDVV
ncbi:hypothetical protein OAA10_00285 [bacterium]|nr:hypothetical protein [bacterium]